MSLGYQLVITVINVIITVIKNIRGRAFFSGKALDKRDYCKL